MIMKYGPVLILNMKGIIPQRSGSTNLNSKNTVKLVQIRSSIATIQ